METIDPTTGKPLPPDAIQRVLYIARQVHVYQIPPATSTKGYNASSWIGLNNERLIFTARLRVLETAIPRPAAAQPVSTGSATQSGGAGASPDDREEDVKVDILLEDPATGQLFAGAPYTSPAVVEPTLDSSRFFAVRVVGEGRKATLGVGFEERSDAMDFNIALQDARKVLGMDQSGPGGGSAQSRRAAAAKASAEKEKRDFSLKEGEMITVNIGRKGRRKPDSPEGVSGEQKDSQAALFSIKPPPSAGGNGNGGAMPFLPPPPKTSDVKADRRRSRNMQLGAESPNETLSKQPSAQELGFDDGEFGEFQ
ncbi:uncharacterized protein IWZ02DRAFT_190235 [Phyllosticta citriasiana]|uniref:NECAP PHear domain-containing protein n=1 Tax=Phyllosticta citriasiana TaxID=595635 RepID=A0ABR1KAM1_9PEZI